MLQIRLGVVGQQCCVRLLARGFTIKSENCSTDVSENVEGQPLFKVRKIKCKHCSLKLRRANARQVYFIYPFPRRLKLGKSLQICCINIFPGA